MLSESSTSTRTPACFKRRGDLLRVIDVPVGDRYHRDLDRREPGREGAGEVLDEDADEPLDRAVERSVDHHRLLPGAVVIDVLEPEAIGEVEVDLDRRHLPVATDRVPDVDVDLRPVERTVAFVDQVLEAGALEGLRDRRLRQLPQLVRAHRLGRPRREPHAIGSEPDGRVESPEEVDGAHELVDDLIRTAEDVRSRPA